MADGKLIFLRPASGSGKLVLGDAHAGSVTPDAAIRIDAGFAGEGAASVRLLAGVPLALDAGFAGDMAGGAGLLWDANVSRVDHWIDLGQRWQQAAPVSTGAQDRWREADNVRVGTQSRCQPAQPITAAVRPVLREAARLRAAAGQCWQEGVTRRAAARLHWQEAERLRAALAHHWQEGAPRRAAIRPHWQDMLRLRAAVHQHWHDGRPARATATGRWQPGLPVHIHLLPHWQEARRPPAGVSRIPPPPVRPPCYDPARLGLLVFDTPYTGDGRLVFVCHRAGPPLPPASIVVPASRSYIVINSIEVRRADDLAGDPLPSETFQMQLDRQSWTWTFSASFHASARDAVAPGPGGQPVELEVRVNGQPFRLQAERIGRSKRFPEHMITASGRGLAAVLDAPHASVQTFSQAMDRTAQQLMTEVLTVNGVGFGWSVDWQITDWLVPGGIWMHQGTWISALADIAGSVGAYLQPHDTAPVLRVLPAWPEPWWHWDTLAPDIELSEGIAEITETEVVDLPGYDRIFVGGEAGGIQADLTRSGMPGTMLKQPMAVHPLITELAAAKQRATAELAESGRMLKHKMTLPVLPTTGVIKPGTVLRYVDDAQALRLGIVRSTAITQQFPVLTQSLEIDSHA